MDELVNSQRELLTSVLEANLALVSVTQNEVVKKISAWAAIIAVPTFIASVYGMNFEHMPELDQSWGYPLALAVMALCVVVLISVLPPHRLAVARQRRSRRRAPQPVRQDAVGERGHRPTLARR